VKTSLGQPRGGTFLGVGFSGVPHRVGCREADLLISAQPNCENDRGLHSSARMAVPPGQAVVEASTYGFGCEDETFGPTHRFASAFKRVTGLTVRTSVQTIHPRRDSPVCFGRQTSQGPVHHPLRWQTNHGSTAASATTEPRFNRRSGVNRITDSTDTSVSTESPRQPACASAQTNRLRRDSPVRFGKQTSHRKRRCALRCTTRGSRKSSPSTLVVNGLRIYVPARAVTRRTKG